MPWAARHSGFGLLVGVWALLLLGCVAPARAEVQAPAQAVAQTAAQTADVVWLSEAFPPFSFVGPKGPQGIAVDLARAALAEARLPSAQFQFVPWQRALVTLAGSRPACVTAMTRTPARQAQYQWVGPFLPADLAVAWRKEEPVNVKAIQPLTGRSVVVVRGDISESAAQQLGAEPSKTTRVASGAIAARMLQAKRVDAWVYGEAVISWVQLSEGLPLENLQISHRQSLGDNYFACNGAVPADYLSRLQNGFDQLRAFKRTHASPYEQILSRYLGATLSGPARVLPARP